MVLLTVGMGLTYASCSKDENACDPNDKESPCYSGIPDGNDFLLVEEKRNGITELRFEYDDKNKMIVYHIHGANGGVSNSQYFTYNNKNLLMAVEHKTGIKHLYKEEYTYGSGTRPESGVLIYEDETISLKYDYTQNTTTETATSSEGDIVALNTYTFDDKGNQVRITMTANEILLSTQEFGDYDDKHYRFTNYPWIWKLSSVNNAKSYKLTEGGPAGAVVNINHLWEFTYNDAGYPTKAEVYDRASKTLVETRTFFYKPAN